MSQFHDNISLSPDICSINTSPPPNPICHRTSSDHLPIPSSVKEKLDSFLLSNRIPNIIFHGPTGVGKKTILQNFLSNIYSHDPKKMKSNIMTVNCCHGKGIKFIREELKFFAKTNIQMGTNFKSVVLINADALTIDAQSALRRCIELFCHNTRFFIVVENKHKLLNPILSRFCEIYIPETTNQCDDCHGFQIINLHRINLVKKDPQAEQKRFIQLHEILKDWRSKMDKKRIESIKNINEGNLNSDSSNLILLTVTLYEKGFSANDIIHVATSLGNMCEDGVKYSNIRQFSEHREGDYLDAATHSLNPRLDVVSTIQNVGRSDTWRHLTLLFCEIKPEFRCEKLLLFILLRVLFDVFDSGAPLLRHRFGLSKKLSEESIVLCRGNHPNRTMDPHLDVVGTIQKSSCVRTSSSLISPNEESNLTVP